VGVEQAGEVLNEVQDHPGGCSAKKQCIELGLPGRIVGVLLQISQARPESEGMLRQSPDPPTSLANVPAGRGRTSANS
jgi:hypothetical protein